MFYSSFLGGLLASQDRGEFGSCMIIEEDRSGVPVICIKRFCRYILCISFLSLYFIRLNYKIFNLFTNLLIKKIHVSQDFMQLNLNFNEL